MESYKRRWETQMARLLSDIRAESVGWAKKLGFRPGPQLRQTVKDEINYWWEYRVGEDEAYEDDPLNCDTVSASPDSPEFIRFACLTALSLGLDPKAGEDVGTPDVWLEMVQDHIELLRRAVRHAGPAAPAAEVAAFVKQERAREKVREAESEIEEARQKCRCSRHKAESRLRVAA